MVEADDSDAFQEVEHGLLWGRNSGDHDARFSRRYCAVLPTMLRALSDDVAGLCRSA
jgi:hypothetical protein